VRRATLNAVKSAIQAVTFDVGGTLIEPWPSVGHVYAAVAAEHGVAGLEPEQLNRNFTAAWRAKGNFDHNQAAWFDLVRRTFGEWETQLPPGFFPAVYQRFESPAVWRIYDEVVPALEALAARDLRLAVVSNWDERLRPLLDRLGLSRYFECLVVSCEVGFTKPSPVIFEHALRRLGLPPESVLHVGDREQEDVVGALAAGLSARLIRREAKSSTAAPALRRALEDFFD